MPTNQPPISVLASFSGEGGVERMVVNLVRGLHDLGEAVEVLMIRGEGAQIARLPEQVPRRQIGTGHSASAIPALARYLRQERPRALLAAKDRAARAAVIARALSRQNTRLVVRLGTNLSTAMAHRSSIERGLRYAPIRLLYPRIDRIVAVSEGVADDTARIARLPRERIAVIRNPVITPELATLAAADCPHPWLADDGPPVILGVGRLQQQKDFPTLIEAFAELALTQPARLIILGEGGQRARLEGQIRELGIEQQVALPGFDPNPYAYLSRARLFVLSSAWEGSPNALTEAMALGTPVVSTNCPSGPEELLDGGRFGPLVSVGDTSALARAMVQTLNRPPAGDLLRAAVGEYEQGRSSAHYRQVLLGACPRID